MEKRVILAMVLSFLVIFVIQMIQARRYREYQRRHPVSEPVPERVAERLPAETPAAPEIRAATAELPSATSPMPAEPRGALSLAQALEQAATSALARRTISFDSPRWRVVFDTRGGALQSVRLKDYAEMEGEIRYWEHKAKFARGKEREFLEEKIARMRQREATVTRLTEELERARGTRREEELLEELRTARAVEVIGESLVAPTLHVGNLNVDADLVYECDADGGPVSSSQEVTFRGRLAGLEVTKQYRLDSESHRIDLLLSVRKAPGAPGAYPDEENYSVWWEPRTTHDFQLSRGRQPTTYDVGGSLIPGDKFQDQLAKGKLRPDQEVNWAVSQGNYFLVALVPEVPALPVRMGRHRSEVALTVRESPLDPGGRPLESRFHIYAGPKTLEGLESQGVGLEEIAYGGWTGGLSRGVLSVLRTFTRFTRNYGVSIILITVLLRVLTHPLNKKQIESTEKMKALQPQLKNLQAKYKNEPQRLQQETWKLYRTHKVNPLGGCLPLLLTMPIFIALYTCFGSAIELRGASFLWIRDLAGPDTIFNIYLPFLLPLIGSILPVNVLPILYGALSIWQQSRMPMDPKQASMMRFFPLFFVVLFYNFASGVILYFFFSNLLMVLGQAWHEKYGKKPALIEVKTDDSSHHKRKNRRSGH